MIATTLHNTAMTKADAHLDPPARAPACQETWAKNAMIESDGGSRYHQKTFRSSQI